MFKLKCVALNRVNILCIIVSIWNNVHKRNLEGRRFTFSFSGVRLFDGNVEYANEVYIKGKPSQFGVYEFIYEYKYMYTFKSNIVVQCSMAIACADEHRRWCHWCCCCCRHLCRTFADAFKLIGFSFCYYRK